MAEFIVKKKKKLSRVEIIPSYQIEEIQELVYNPFIFDDNDLAIEEEEPIIEDLTPPEPVELKQRFYREFQFTNLRIPQEIDLRRVPPVAVLKEEHDRAIQEAFQAGYNNCFNELKPKFDAEKAQLEEWIRNIDLVADELNTEFSVELKKFEDTLLSLSIMIAQHILEKEISAHSSNVIEQVRKAINTVEENKIFKIRLNPSNLDTLIKVKSTLFEDKSKAEGISLIADESVDLGGCILETSAGIVDGRIQTQLNMIAEQIYESGIEDLFEDELEPTNQEIEEEVQTDVISDENNQDNSEKIDEDLLAFGLENEEEFILDEEISDTDLEYNEFDSQNSEAYPNEIDFLKDLENFDLGDNND